MSRFGEVKDRLQWVVESDREDVADHPGGEDVTGNEVPSLSERIHRNLALIVLSQKVARFGFENQLFEKIQDWRTRC
jgi:hypothetical protein